MSLLLLKFSYDVFEISILNIESSKLLFSGICQNSSEGWDLALLTAK